jgi:hydroxymethylpyrimidine/phosphomethylpyrimidine kinase
VEILSRPEKSVSPGAGAGFAAAMADLPVALTIAGSDSGGGAGVQADLLTFAAHGVFGTSAITCLTAQNPDGVTAVVALDPAFVTEQAQQVLRFFDVRVVKTGMLFSAAIVAAVAAVLRERRGLPAVIDPVMVATSGAALLQPAAVAAVREQLLPLAALVTPNLDEAAVLLGRRPANDAEMRAAAAELAQMFGVPFLLKGGHLTGDELVDWLAWPEGRTERFVGHRIPEVDTHGSGCTLASAIAAQLALGRPLAEAVADGRGYLRRGLQRPLSLRGRRFIAHLA